MGRIRGSSEETPQSEPAPPDAPQPETPPEGEPPAEGDQPEQPPEVPAETPAEADTADENYRRAVATATTSIDATVAAQGDQPTSDEVDGGIAEARAPAGAGGAGVQAGRVDNMTARSGSDPSQGGFVSVDRTNDDAAKALVDAGVPEGQDGYGVFVEPAEVDEDTGYPHTAVVRLRDDTHALVTVPFAALRPAVAGGR